MTFTLAGLHGPRVHVSFRTISIGPCNGVGGQCTNDRSLLSYIQISVWGTNSPCCGADTGSLEPGEVNDMGGPKYVFFAPPGSNSRETTFSFISASFPVASTLYGQRLSAQTSRKVSHHLKLQYRFFLVRHLPDIHSPQTLRCFKPVMRFKDLKNKFQDVHST